MEQANYGHEPESPEQVEWLIENPECLVVVIKENQDGDQSVSFGWVDTESTLFQDLCNALDAGVFQEEVTH